jgi:dTDP-4-dehydrorhamnose reductase
MTILVTGGGGTVGSYFRSLASAFAEPVEVLAKGELDVTDFSAVQARLRSKPSWVVNLAAATDLDRAEKDPVWAYRLNAVGAENIALAAREQGVRMVQVSTVGIFCGDGKQGPFTELDEPAPVNVYAKTKLAGERAVQRILPEATIVRTAWVMGGGKDDKKFVGKVRDKLLANEPVKAVGDIVGSPTYARDLVLAIRDLIGACAFGLFHVTNSGAASRYDLVLEMRRILGSTSVVESVAAVAFPLPAARPPSEVSTSLSLAAHGLTELRDWRDALKDYLTTSDM